MLFARFEGFGTNDWLPPAFLANATLEYKYTRSLYTSLGLIAGVQDGGEPAEIGEGVFHVHRAKNSPPPPHLPAALRQEPPKEVMNGSPARSVRRMVPFGPSTTTACHRLASNRRISENAR